MIKSQIPKGFRLNQRKRWIMTDRIKKAGGYPWKTSKPDLNA
jgi:hypothetical protein